MAEKKQPPLDDLLPLDPAWPDYLKGYHDLAMQYRKHPDLHNIITATLRNAVERHTILSHQTLSFEAAWLETSTLLLELTKVALKKVLH